MVFKLNSIPANRILVNIGDKYGRLTVTGEPVRFKNYIKYPVICECGNTKLITSQALREGKTQSCGCLQKERTGQASFKHGFSHTNIHNIWMGIIQRCTDINSSSYKNYGGRGIKISDEWLDFTVFLSDMGDKPKGLTIDRKNNNGDYSKENCHWVDRKQQANNRRSSKLLTYKNETMTQSQWEDKYNMRKGMLWERLNRGWTLERALLTPPKTF